MIEIERTPIAPASPSGRGALVGALNGLAGLAFEGSYRTLNLLVVQFRPPFANMVARVMAMIDRYRR